tara:strand:- start:31 stop:264 length:234 start_codon:yes stop_codon:yes gene_type:complete
VSEVFQLGAAREEDDDATQERLSTRLSLGGGISTRAAQINLGVRRSISPRAFFVSRYFFFSVFLNISSISDLILNVN